MVKGSPAVTWCRRQARLSSGRLSAVPLRSLLGLFAGIGGMELGLQQAGFDGASELFEHWLSAQSVLARRFPDSDLQGDVLELRDLRGADVVTAGFPCTDLSQAGRTAGLEGSASGLVRHLLELLRFSRPEWVLIENVPNMLRLGRGSAISEITCSLEAVGYNWAYRTVDSRSFGLPHRRKRVYLLASTAHDPASVLFREDNPSEDADGAAHGAWRDSAFGFYSTEGNRGIGWAIDAVPTLKGSTTVSIPSPPAIWLPGNEPGRRIVRPTIEAAETLQGFPAGWTAPAPSRDRWKLVGNAVSVPVAKWIGEGLLRPDDDGFQASDTVDKVPHTPGSVWPRAACAENGKVWDVGVSEWPRRPSWEGRHLASVLDSHGSEPLSFRATKGFRDRLRRSSLKYAAEFMAALDEHVALTTP